ncbi:MAG: hypothetical protein ACE5KH_04720 [Candidatus Geothermarchaeales archaeon]
MAFEKLPKHYEKLARNLSKCSKLHLGETIRLSEAFLANFLEFVAENGITPKEAASLEDVGL